MTEKELAELDLAMQKAELLNHANDVMRSAYAIAQRSGRKTNWPAFRARLLELLIEQSKILNGTSHEPAATCTAKTFKHVTDGRKTGWQKERAGKERTKVVPCEPTPAMNAAGFAINESEHDPAGVYRAMLAAAPGDKK